MLLLHRRIPAPFLALVVGVLLTCSVPGLAQMVTGAGMAGYAKTLGVTPRSKDAACTVRLTESSVPGNILWPGQQARFQLQIVNNTDQPLQARGRVHLIAYGTKGLPGDVWTPQMFKVADVAATPFDARLAPNGYAEITLVPRVPARLGAYALVADLGPLGRQFVTTCVRTFRPDGRSVQYPHFCLDELPLPVLTRLGVHAIRWGIGYKPTTDADFAGWYADRLRALKRLQAAHITVLAMVGGGEFFDGTQPLGRPRPWLNSKGVMQDTKFDLAWLPKYDGDFERFCYRFARDAGWPRGPITAFSLWNEPWEGISISGWGADMLRYREIYTHLFRGVDKARQQDHAVVLVGGCDSSSNALDKLFCDGTQTFLPMFDFLSVHYQGLSSMATVKTWVNRKSPYGRVKIWDTESWVANTDDRVAAVVAGDRTAGYDRAMGIYGGNIAEENHSERRLPSGKTAPVTTVNAWSVAASVGAATHFIGERPFQRLLFQNGLPWVMVFADRARSDDGTLVVVGDLGETFGADCLPFRTARGFAETAHKAQLRRQLDALPAGAPAAQRAALEKQWETPETLRGATLTLPDGNGQFHLFDFYGNPVPAIQGRLVVPLDGRGFFVRASGPPGGFARLLAAVQRARIAGISPLAIVARDMIQPAAAHPLLHLTLTNILNRPVQGRLEVTLVGSLLPLRKNLRFAPNETQEVRVRLRHLREEASNAYPLTVRFDAGRDGLATHAETLHVNIIPRRVITVDGNLADWQGVPPQTILASGASQPTLTEQAWLPFKKFGAGAKHGLASAYLAYDSRRFYFAAKVADSTPDPGMPRFETRDDNAFFYPARSYAVRLKHPATAPVRDSDTAAAQPLDWPAGVRRYSYRKDPELPSGNAPSHDNIQIAFNVLPPAQKFTFPAPPGVMPGFTSYTDTDYEYALNPVAPQYGGGTEIWRLQVPGMPHKHFYPRQPKSPYDGPVKNGKLVIVRTGNTLIYECAIPWSEMPAVKARLDAGQTVKFSYRVNDNADGPLMELSQGRSVAKRNGSFHVDWVEHWANELEFGFWNPADRNQHSRGRAAQ